MLTFALGITALLMGFAPTNGASAASFRYQAGYSLQSGWLCYGWSNGALHCTQRWHRDASGKLISDNPAWVPNVGGAPTSKPAASSSGAAQFASSELQWRAVPLQRVLQRDSAHAVAGSAWLLQRRLSHQPGELRISLGLWLVQLVA